MRGMISEVTRAIARSGWVASAILAGACGCSTPPRPDVPVAFAFHRDTSIDLPYEARTRMAWLDDAHVALIDGDATQLVVLDREGHERRVGRKGEGPGEYHAPMEAFPRPAGGLLISDLFVWRIKTLDSALRPAAVVGTPSLLNGIVGTRGDTIVVWWQLYPTDSLGRRVGALVPGQVGAATITTLASIDPIFNELRELEEGQKVPSPDLVLRSDGRFVLGESRDYRLWLLDREGHVLKAGGRPELPEESESPPTPEEIETELRRVRRVTHGDPEMIQQAEGAMRRRYASPRYRFRRFSTDPEGRLWVIADRGRLDSTRVDLFDGDLLYEGTLTLDGHVRGLASRGDQFVTLVGDPGEGTWRLDWYTIASTIDSPASVTRVR